MVLYEGKKMTYSNRATDHGKEDLRVTLARIEEKLDGYIDKSADHEDRLRSVETRQSMAIGGCALVTALISIAAVVVVYIHK